MEVEGAAVEGTVVVVLPSNFPELLVSRGGEAGGFFGADFLLDVLLVTLLVVILGVLFVMGGFVNFAAMRLLLGLCTTGLTTEKDF